MHKAEELYRAGKLTEAIGSLQTYLRDNPSDKKARSFLFELLCFAGEWQRARKHLAILGEQSNESKYGIAFYLAALGAEEERQAFYDVAIPAATDASPAPSGPQSGTCDGKPFAEIRDLDARLGDSLEFFTAGKYHRIPFRYLKSLTIEPPTKVRDLLWVRANAETTADVGDMELESILIPVLYPYTALFDDDQTRLGRTTDWAATEDGEIPCGQRILVIGGEEIPLLSLGALEFDHA